ncbi:hypothetical protein PSJE_15545 [Pseudomonas jessenii]|uniref:PIN like domain-containing protein n=1 Tax=Pseudomonas jessenii TaxID=77298 RepID=A0A231GJK2_PSEJE|nr:PIN-like domain-containing protein [Pseudomonas jessenii]OXR36752.1 hypothetical protein PSJE_15545 [Pseudomonas jessenii]SEB83008.1 hypothetical protein SAMN04490187_2132 [Pseudomonas jessenii]
MREAFSEHFVGEPERQEKLWADCIFVLDTNVLLDLYRFSDSAREALFKVMEFLGERLWIPYQVAAEYFENRLTVIEAQSKAYAESISGLKVAKEKFNSGSRHPFVSDEVFNNFISSYDLMIKELESRQETYLSYVGNDVIKTKIGTLLNGRVGQPYSEERLLAVADEGEKRYLENIPPGFQDFGKMPEATTNKLRLKKFGDLILWKQVIEKAVADNKSVILVTGEKKDDWWLKSNKGLVSALPALTKEFMDAAKQDFYLYATDRFLLKANEFLAQSTSDGVVEEVRAINKADADLNDNFESALLDQAINVAWPEIPSGASWVSAKTWADRAAKSPWHQRPTDHSRNFALNFSMSKQKQLRDKIRDMRVRLDDLRAEHEDLIDLQENLFASGFTLDDERLQKCKKRVLTIETMISAHEVEFVALREEMHAVNAHYKSLLGDGADE